MQVGKRLKELRQSKHLKQSDMSYILGVSSSAVGAYEREERQLNYDLLKKYADYFNVSIDYILCNSENEYTVEKYQSMKTLELCDIFNSHDITLNGCLLSDTEKQRILDISTVICFDKLKKN